MDIVKNAKDIIDNVSTKAGEFICDQKNNLRIAKVCSELKRAYEKLGRLCYRKVKGMIVDDNEFDSAVNIIEALKDELECLRSGNCEQPCESAVFEDGEPVNDVAAAASADNDEESAE